MKTIKTYQLILAAAVSINLIACTEKMKPEAPVDDFDKTAMLTNLADNVIVPAYVNLAETVDALKLDLTAFASEPTNLNLSKAKQSFNATYESFQKVSIYEIGPAASIGFSQSLNRFPTDTIQIEQNLNESNVKLGNADNVSAKGFPALEYILYFYGNAIVNNANDEQPPKQLAYIQLLIDDISSQVNVVLGQWQSDYATEFVNANGNDLGSSLGKLTNAFSIALEQVKNVKLGIPLGKKTLNEPRVELVEGKYMGKTAALIIAQTQGLYDFYLGKNEINGVGFDDYLLHLNASSNGTQLHAQITAGFDLALSQLNRIPDPMAEAIITDDTTVQAAYGTFQSTLIRLIKVDMSSAFGVQISYVDNDGD